MNGPIVFLAVILSFIFCFALAIWETSQEEKTWRQEVQKGWK